MSDAFKDTMSTVVGKRLVAANEAGGGDRLHLYFEDGSLVVIGAISGLPYAELFEPGGLRPSDDRLALAETIERVLGK